MADAALTARPAFAGLMQGAGVTVAERHGLGLATLQARKGQEAALRARVAERFGCDLPDGPRRAAKDGTTFLGTGPGAWLAVREGGGNGFAAALASETAGLASVADQSDGYAVLRLAGARVADTLAKGTTIDLHPRAFRVGDAAATAVAHVGVILWRLEDARPGAPVFELALFRSYAGSLWHWLEESAAEYGLAVDPADV